MTIVSQHACPKRVQDSLWYLLFLGLLLLSLVGFPKLDITSKLLLFQGKLPLDIEHIQHRHAFKEVNSCDPHETLLFVEFKD